MYFSEMLFRTFSLLFIVASLAVNAQNAFFLKDSVIRLYKDTDASPVHWYAEIINKTNVDTNLRWKAVFSPTWPSSWELSFDDQNNFHSQVGHLDSADFTLFGNTSFTQKLIIGNKLNNVTGVDSVDFLIYHPAQPENAVIQRFVFYIDEGQNFDVEEEHFNGVFFNRESKAIHGLDLLEGEFALIDLQGRVVQKGNLPQTELNVSEEIGKIFFLSLSSNNAGNQVFKQLKFSF